MALDHDAFVKRLVAAMEHRDPKLWDEFYTEDCVQFYPQSGETIKGRANARAVIENYPGGVDSALKQDTVSVPLTDQRWVMTEVYTLVGVEGTGDVGTATLRVHYPDGSTWWLMVIYRLRAGKIAQATTFFAPTFEPPAWRAQWVEVEKPNEAASRA